MLPVDRHWYSASSSSGYASLESSISSDFWNEACEDDEVHDLTLLRNPMLYIKANYCYQPCHFFTVTIAVKLSV